MGKKKEKKRAVAASLFQVTAKLRTPCRDTDTNGERQWMSGLLTLFLSLSLRPPVRLLPEKRSLSLFDASVGYFLPLHKPSALAGARRKLPKRPRGPKRKFPVKDERLCSRKRSSLPKKIHLHNASKSDEKLQ